MELDLISDGPFARAYRLATHEEFVKMLWIMRLGDAPKTSPDLPFLAHQVHLSAMGDTSLLHEPAGIPFSCCGAFETSFSLLTKITRYRARILEIG